MASEPHLLSEGSGNAAPLPDAREGGSASQYRSPGLNSAEPGDGKKGVASAWLETAWGESVSVGPARSLGRCESNHLVLPGERVSRKHALIHARREDEFWLSDLGSSNGTYVNGRRLAKPARLYDSDQITIGPHRLSFRQPGSRKRPSPSPTLAEMTLCEAKAERGWLLLVHLDSPTRVSRMLAPEEVPTVLGRWQEECKEVIERHGGQLRKYLTEGFLAFWPDRHTEQAAVARAVSELKLLQARSQPPFCLILHYGQVSVDNARADGEESLSGAAVSFVYHVRKLSVALKAASLVSEVAQALLRPFLGFREAGQHALNGFEGEHVFYRL